jgi:hypothetical protein
LIEFLNSYENWNDFMPALLSSAGANNTLHDKFISNLSNSSPHSSWMILNSFVKTGDI